VSLVACLAIWKHDSARLALSYIQSHLLL